MQYNSIAKYWGMFQSLFTYKHSLICLAALVSSDKYLAGLKQKIPVSSSDLEGAAIRCSIGADLAEGDGLHGLCLPLPVQRQRRRPHS